MDELSKGTLNQILNGRNVEEPIFQLLSYKRLAGTTSDWYRLIVSDGLRIHQYTMLSTELNYLFENGIMTKDAVFKVLNYKVRSLNDEIQTLVILGGKILNLGNEVQRTTGNPIANKLETNNSPVHHEVMKDTIEPSALRDTNNSSYKGPIVPIITLSPKNRQAIKARAISKSPIKKWSNNKGKLFSMHLLDDSDEISCVAFNKECDKFHGKIEDKKVYYISNYALKDKNPQYNKLKNKYEIVINNNTKIEECHDDATIPSVLFNFCPISDVENKQTCGEIDALGVIIKSSDVKYIVTKTGTKSIKDIVIVDDSRPHGAKMCVTLWEQRAQDFDCPNNTILAIKGARVDEFNGKKLTVISSTVIEKNPDLPKADKLRSWYDGGGYSEDAGSLSGRQW
ncbi:PREDICTED: replication protein A 70 kDa DNA-binding subunit-like isoform X2 [Dinoponera quadriceps]|uniref:Replication protein A 70 kDa DNA-binding subunit n=1 Tax=Dinoponera quadriceps TaxID=609295 RepID=A0A6P3XKQ4_DINQU|nr:PREDICTED: replication protein A 70 kDa DNA-binding subunit-like isoform X2 [Dinoponera quadriceps]